MRVLIHLTKQPGTLATILREGTVRALTPYGAAHKVDSLAISQKVTSFSEMAALASVADLAQRHGHFGLGFLRSWMQDQGAAPVWYLPRDSEVQVEFFNRVRDLAFRNAPDPEHVLWRITPFIDYPQDAEVEGASVPYDWRWEREWRVRGDLSFQNDDVAILIAPEAHHENEVETAPYVDYSSPWDDEHREQQAEMREELNGWLDEMARDDI